MSAWEYLALDAEGRHNRGVLEGDSARQVRQQLRERGLVPFSVTEADRRDAAQSTDRWRNLLTARRTLGNAQLAVVVRQLATLTASGTPIEEALGAAARQHERRSVKTLLLAVRARVVEGHSLAAALSSFPRSFPEIHVATIRAGEQSGHLAAVLERLADFLEAQRGVRDSIALALVYPAVLALVALLVVMGLLAWIVPEIVGVFDAMDAELPGLTRFMIATSDVIRGYGWLIGIVVAALLVAARALLARPRVRERVDRWLLRTPVFGPLLRGMETGRMTRTLSILVRSGVPLVEALSMAASVIRNRPMHDALRQVAVQVREGNSLSRMLEKSGCFPPMTLHLIGSGEHSGRLGEMLERAATQQERETETGTRILAGLLEPAVIVVAGTVVMLIVLAVLLPIFELNQLVR